MRPLFFTAPFALITITLLIIGAPRNEVSGNSSNSPYSVILISVDGLRPDAIRTLGPERVPAFYRLRREGSFTDNARTAVDYTITLPNHTGMITGRLVTGEDGHNWTINRDTEFPPGITLHSQKGSYLNSVFSTAHDHGMRTALFASKSKFSLFDDSYNEENGAPDTTGVNNGRDKIDVYESRSNSEKIIDHLERTMKKDRFDFLMVHIRNPDTAGHVFSWNDRVPSPYMSAVKKADELLDDIFEQIDSEPAWNGRTYIVLTADHGGPVGLNQHKAEKDSENYTVPYYVWGPGIPAGGDLYEMNPDSRKDPGTANPKPGEGIPPIRNAGAGNLCLFLLGLPSIEGSTVNHLQDFRVKPAPVAEVSSRAKGWR